MVVRGTEFLCEVESINAPHRPFSAGWMGWDSLEFMASRGPVLAADKCSYSGTARAHAEGFDIVPLVGVTRRRGPR